jgi:hypothetical protein
VKEGYENIININIMGKSMLALIIVGIIVTTKVSSQMSTAVRSEQMNNCTTLTNSTNRCEGVNCGKDADCATGFCYEN